jgi:hypothetical protein
MKTIPAIPRTLAIAPRIIWFEPPERALSDPIRFMAYAMTYARHEDMRVIREYVSDDDFREALDRAPPGIIDPRSWAYWNSKMGRYPPPPMPKRRFGFSEAHSHAASHGTAEDRSHIRQVYRYSSSQTPRISLRQAMRVEKVVPG